MVFITCGNPLTGPASFTRFVLPFAYGLEECTASEYSSWFELIDIDEMTDNCDDNEFLGAWLWRRLYFTPETGRVLYDRAARFQLVARGEKDTPIPRFIGPFDLPVQLRDGVVVKTVRAHLLPPRLILFDARSTGRSSEGGLSLKQDSPDPLQTGFLVLDLWFESSQNVTLADLLHINEGVRYWQCPYAKHNDSPAADALWTSYRQLVDSLTTAISKAASLPLEEGEADTAYTGRWATLLRRPIRDPGSGRWLHLFPEEWDHPYTGGLVRAVNPALPAPWMQPEMPKNAHRWAIYADNRAFVWSCALLPQGAQSIAPGSPLSVVDARKSGWWIKLLNVDRPTTPPHSNAIASDFEAKWAEDRTYTRWVHYGTLYGNAYHAGVMLAAPIEEPPLWQHFSTFYFDQVLLLLYLRVGAFRFSEQLHWLTACWRGLHSGNSSPSETRATVREVRDSFIELRKRFSHFTNLYQFPLISNQQQGVEMYEYARRIMDIQELFDEVKEEIAGTHELLEMQNAFEFADTQETLAYVATLGVAAGFAVTLIFTDVAGSLFQDIGALLCGGKITGSWWALWLMFWTTVLVGLLLWRWLIRIAPRINEISRAFKSRSRSKRGGRK